METLQLPLCLSRSLSCLSLSLSLSLSVCLHIQRSIQLSLDIYKRHRLIQAKIVVISDLSLFPISNVNHQEKLRKLIITNAIFNTSLEERYGYFRHKYNAHKRRWEVKFTEGCASGNLPFTISDTPDSTCLFFYIFWTIKRQCAAAVAFLFCSMQQ